VSERKAADREKLRGHVLGLLFAGNETTAAALAWALVHGARQPTEWAKVRSDPTNAAAAFNDETMRLSPVVWGFARSSSERGSTLTSGEIATKVARTEPVVFYLRGMNRDAERWPTRWSSAPSAT
jgi:4-methoxybenzoate monooxygenase (O-demethylating)